MTELDSLRAENERLQGVDRNYQASTAELLAEIERLRELHQWHCGCAQDS